MMSRVVREDFLEEMSCEERLKETREVDEINANDGFSHLKLVFPVMAELQWLQQRM